ncbi:MAG TPA: kelch repeat-containing protein, partial [Thermoplasmata archaeon]|nr:kelch repeat-containing protein [Thermoplasmata archaeon]
MTSHGPSRVQAHPFSRAITALLRPSDLASARSDRPNAGPASSRSVWPPVLVVLVLVAPAAWALSLAVAAPPAPIGPGVDRASAGAGPGTALLAAAERSLASGAAGAGGSPARAAHPANLAPGWNQTALSGSQPSQRAAAALAYDPVLNTTVLFGGYDPSDLALGDTWEFNGGTWTSLGFGPSTSPPARWNANFVFDPADGYLVLHGGRNTTQFFNDTWSYSGTGWSRITSTLTPPAGYGTMTYDAKDGYVLLYGAAQGNLPSSPGGGWSDLTVTWKFLAGQWTNLTANVTGTPPATIVAAMAYDPVDGYALLFGGETAAQADSSCPFVAGLTWSYANGTWTNRTPGSSANVPGGAGGIATTALTYDPSLHALVLFGGEVDQGGACGPYGDTWEYAHGNWTNLT